MSRFGDAPRTFDAVGKFDEPMLYVCPPRVKKGVIVRGDVELDSPLIATLPVGTQMTVYRSKHTAAARTWSSARTASPAKPEKFSLNPPPASVRDARGLHGLKWSQTQDPGEVEIVMKLNPGTKKDEIDVLFNYRRLRRTWTYNERNRKLEISLTKDSDTIVWCAAFLAKDAEGNVPLDYEEEAAERERMERFLPKRF
ncbi:hypothetical protein JL720_7218 [Aureococcus anophagefferens]|nr:hypothetical protein JL720_7218 [Aureococcus anophagefferens]